MYISDVKFAYVSVDYSVCSACCVFDGVGELYDECVCYLLVCRGCFVAERDCVVVSLARFFISYSMYSSPQCVRVLFVMPSFIKVFLPYVCFVLLYEGSYLEGLNILVLDHMSCWCVWCLLAYMYYAFCL